MTIEEVRAALVEARTELEAVRLENAQMRTELNAIGAGGISHTPADMFWDAEDTEDVLYADDEASAIDELLNRHSPELFPVTFTLQRAKRLDSIEITATAYDPKTDTFTYEKH